VRLRGGLGNQLFGAYAALWLKRRTGIAFALQLDGIDRSHAGYNYDIRTCLFGEMIEYRSHKSIKSRIFEKFLIEDRPLLKKQVETLLNYSRIRNDDMPPDKLLALLIRHIESNSEIDIEGFFQDFFFFDECTREIPTFKLRNPSKKFSESLELARNIRPIMIHIRLGDYIQNNIGILSNQYFIDSLEILSEKVKTSEVWIFSDTPEEASKYLAGIRGYRYRIIPPEGDPAETLFLMAENNGFICSNSTFSFWAAKISKTDHIVAPRNLSIDGALLIKNSPRNWIYLENSWKT